MVIGVPESHPVSVPRSDRVAHRHEWQLRGVEFDDAHSVLRYDCVLCDEVWFA